MASTTHMTYHQSLWMMQFNRPQLVFVHYLTTLTRIALQQQNFIYYSSETFAALSQFQTVESLSSPKSLVSPNTCKFWGKQHLKMRHYQNISRKVRGFREILSQCTAYTVINKQALQHISHSFQMLPSTHPNWLPKKMFKKCQQYNTLWKLFSNQDSNSGLSNVRWPGPKTLYTENTKSRVSQRGSLVSNCHLVWMNCEDRINRIHFKMEWLKPYQTESLNSS